MTLGPCVYPGCQDKDDNPRLTKEGICQPCRSRYRQLPRRLLADYERLDKEIGELRGPTNDGRVTARPFGFGHPAEWLSDRKREIAGSVDAIEDDLREQLGHSRPADPQRAESSKVASAIGEHPPGYLRTHFDWMCTMSGAADVAAKLDELHRKLWASSGLGPQKQWLPFPCGQCNSRTMHRLVGDDRSDTITCHGCKRKITSDEYAWETRKAVDRLRREREATGPRST